MKENFMTYLWILMLSFATAMTLIGILRWVADGNKRREKLSAISICSFIILVIMLLMGNWEAINTFLESVSEVDGSTTNLLINVSKITIKVLLVVIVVAFSLIIAFIAGLLVKYSGEAIFCAISKNASNSEEQLKQNIDNSDGQSKQNASNNEGQLKQNASNSEERLNQKLKEDTGKLAVLLKSPIFIVGIVGGILALYLILPLVMGKNTESIAKCWISGVDQIVKICTVGVSEEVIDGETTSREVMNGEITGEEGGNDTLVSGLALYSLIFILILGIGYGVGNILFEIIRERFEKKTVFLNEYSNAIGLLAVGISILFMVSSSGEFELADTLIKFGKPFVVVIFVIALGIFTLEIVRLLIDMKEKLIRREARYLFVFLVGLCSVIILKAFSIVYNTIISILGKRTIQSDSAEEKIVRIYDYIIEKVAIDMKEEMNVDNSLDTGDEVPYNSFRGTTTRK